MAPQMVCPRCQLQPQRTWQSTDQHKCRPSHATQCSKLSSLLWPRPQYERTQCQRDQTGSRLQAQPVGTCSNTVSTTSAHSLTTPPSLPTSYHTGRPQCFNHTVIPAADRTAIFAIALAPTKAIKTLKPAASAGLTVKAARQHKVPRCVAPLAGK